MSHGNVAAMWCKARLRKAWLVAQGAQGKTPEGVVLVVVSLVQLLARDEMAVTGTIIHLMTRKTIMLSMKSETCSALRVGLCCCECHVADMLVMNCSGNCEMGKKRFSFCNVSRSIRTTTWARSATTGGTTLHVHVFVRRKREFCFWNG